ncbi:MAG TPA: M20/M25/M40 family metallo-hydrolase [Terriglobales bacterium]|nr:M20/M25/M40 family metallo-hydrolase [Terriglobales bacterium]HUL14904.1 M20/M25/M40 family metallo-hydrolase [Terriglobales bacterium]
MTRRVASRFLLALIGFLLTSGVPAFAQIQQQSPDAVGKLKPPQGTGACSATEASDCAEAAAKILPQVLGPSPMIANLERLTDDVGGRVSGTPQMAKAVEWAVAAFRAEGVEVHTEKYTMPVTWSEGNTRLEVLGPVSFPVHLVSTGWSPATPPDGIEAKLVDVGDGTAEEFARAGGIRGAILLVHSEIGSTWADLFDEYLKPPAIIAQAIRGGASAILWMGARERLLLYRHTNSLNGQIDKIPQAVVAREDAMRLARLAAANPGKVVVKLLMPNKIGGPVEQENVVGEIRGREKPDEAVILGAHLDSWELGTGALDDGCNAALVIEAARAIKATGLVPRRTIRFVLFSGEEQGTLGSYAYVREHLAEMDEIRGVVIFDTGSGRVTGYSLGGRTDIEPAIREILKPLDAWGADHDTDDASFGTDNFDFLLEGVPNLVANQEIANYLVNYHAASDTFDKVDQRELKLNTAIAALTVWGIADHAEPIGKRLTRAELDALVKKTGLDEQMKTLGYWDEWAQGERGRRP